MRHKKLRESEGGRHLRVGAAGTHWLSTAVFRVGGGAGLPPTLKGPAWGCLWTVSCTCPQDPQVVEVTADTAFALQEHRLRFTHRHVKMASESHPGLPARIARAIGASPGTEPDHLPLADQS